MKIEDQAEIDAAAASSAVRYNTVQDPKISLWALLAIVAILGAAVYGVLKYLRG